MHVSCKSYASPIRISCEYHATVANASSVCMLYASPARVSCKFQDSLSLPHSLSLSLSLSDSLSLPLCESNKLQPLGELHEIVKRSCNTETQVHGRASEAKLLGKKATTPTLKCDREAAEAVFSPGNRMRACVRSHKHPQSCPLATASHAISCSPAHGWKPKKQGWLQGQVRSRSCFLINRAVASQKAAG